MTTSTSNARCCGQGPWPSRDDFGALAASCMLCPNSPTYWQRGRQEVDPYAALRDEPAAENAEVVELPAAPAPDPDPAGWTVDGGLFEEGEAA